jgi:DNA-binding response OmpR family regulator
MHRVLVACKDAGLKKLCREQLHPLNCDLLWANSGEAALQHIQRNHVDLVILHSDAADNNCFTVLEVLRSFRPDVPILLTSDRFDYWNNFMSWLADDCLVPSPGLTELRDRVSDLLHLGSSDHADSSAGKFAVDWE